MGASNVQGGSASVAKGFKKRAVLLAAVLFSLWAAHAAAQSPAETMQDISELARFRRVERVGMFSSYDRGGGNDDGFPRPQHSTHSRSEPRQCGQMNLG